MYKYVLKNTYLSLWKIELYINYNIVIDYSTKSKI